MAQNWGNQGYNNNYNNNRGGGGGGGYNNNYNNRGGGGGYNNQPQYNNNYNNNNNHFNNNQNQYNKNNNNNNNRSNQYNPNGNQYNNQYNNNNNNNYNNPNQYNSNNNRGGVGGGGRGYNNNNNNNNNYNNNNYNNNNPNRGGGGGYNPQQSNPPKSQPLQKSKPASQPKPAKSPKKINKSREYDHLFKLVLIGDATVGKTSLLLRFADDSFKDNYISTIGVDFRFRTLTIDGELVKLQIWDTAGQERFRTITSAYYRGADGIILIYDITNNESFQHVQDWLNEVHKVTGSSITKLIIGNKNDLYQERRVNIQQAQQYALSVQASIIETSAKTANNVDKSFTMIAKELVKRGQVVRKSIALKRADSDDDDDDRQKKKCCQII